MRSKLSIQFLLSIPQFIVLWYAAIKFAEKADWELLAAFLSFPYLILFPIGPFLFMLAVGLYLILWFWLEPLLYLVFLRKKFPITNKSLRNLKLVSFVLVPMIVFSSMKSNEVSPYSNPDYFNSNQTARCHVDEFGNKMPNEDIYQSSCVSKQGCEWIMTNQDPSGYNYSCCPTDEKERNAKQAGSTMYSECVTP